LIGIVDYNMGNLASVKNAFSLLGEEVVVESNPDKLKDYDKLILPGVGAFGDAMQHLQECGMDEAVKAYAQSGNYMLGICLGMQLLFESSEEFGSNEGLGLIKGKIIGFEESKFSEPLKVPHMGWNRMFTQDHPLFMGMDTEH
jgi:glutamine amidotransferase